MRATHARDLCRCAFRVSRPRGGGQRAALFCSLIETCKLNGVDPHAYMIDVLTKLPTAKARGLDALLPWNYRTQPQSDAGV